MPPTCLHALLLLTHFMPLAYFNTPWEHQETFPFLVFSADIGRDQ